MTWHDDWAWWKRGIIYQIYPRSFQDSNGDGCGDLRGILDRLDYLAWLGVDALWLSPIYPSPMKDFGYDIADYTGIDPIFGSMADFDALLDQAHARGLRVIMDLVPNHTSDQHPWFRQSASERDSCKNPKRNWYIWRDPAPDGGPPNNWLSEFAGSAWEWHEASGQYYYHAFLKEQPDLNWRNPEVRAAIYDIMRFWLDKGVDGFRVDVVWHLIKDACLRHNPENPDYDPSHQSPYQALVPVYSTDQPDVHHVMREMRNVIDEYPSRLLVGEVYLPIEKLVTYYGDEKREAHLPFNFQLIGTPWHPLHIRRVVDTYEASLQAQNWPNWVLGNHDQSRLASRIGRDQARLAALLLLTLRGTPTLYYGDEIGMVNIEVPSERARDPREINCPGRGLGRDPARSPMQWDSSDNAGFTQGNPWLPVPSELSTCNVATQQEDKDSLLSLYQRLIRLRKQEPALAVGDYAPLMDGHNVFAYLRRHNDTAFLILLNFTDSPQTYTAHGISLKGEIVIASDYSEFEGRATGGNSIALAPHQGLILRLAYYRKVEPMEYQDMSS